MFANRLLLPIQKEEPAAAVLISHRLMVRAGLIRQLGSGLYSWLPVGLLVFRNVEKIVREEMDTVGAQELLLPCVQPSDLWEESGRWHDYGPELLRMKDRHGRDFCMGPTHEEVVTHIVRNEISSYKQLPFSIYQIHTKFRDEIRPRYGVMRGREFTMKDAYSFHADQASLAKTYQDMRDAYIRIFTRLGIDFKIVAADTGSIGGSRSEEFHVLAAAGEDAIAFSGDGSYAANVDLVPTPPPQQERPMPTRTMELIATPGLFTIKALEEKMSLAANKGIKTLLVRAAEWTEEEPKIIALLVRGDRELNAVKAESLPQVALPLVMATKTEIVHAVDCSPGSIGPVNLPIPCIADYELSILSDFACGANKEEKHFVGVNWERDCPLPPLADLRNITAGEPSPNGTGKLEIKKGIEVGHIFQLGSKYAQAMNAQVSDETGEKKTLKMGCYGIGIDRIVAACIEQNHDEKGIIWSPAVAPFHIVIIPLPLNDEVVSHQAMTFYQNIRGKELSVLYDNRDMRAGAKFSAAELLGIPYRVVISTKTLAHKGAECKKRTEEKTHLVPLEDLVEWLSCRFS